MPESQLPWAGGTVEPLLKTKLFVPRVRHGSVARPRLFALIDQGLSRKLTLISAPAGSGKTTLLSEWCETETGRATPLGWVSLEAADNHPHRFWLYVVQALDRLRPGSLGEVFQMLGGPQPAPVETAVRLLINQMAELEHDAVLVLDDYHVIAAEAIHRSVALLLEHLPPRLHLVITTRVDPPLPYRRLHGAGPAHGRPAGTGDSPLEGNRGGLRPPTAGPVWGRTGCPRRPEASQSPHRPAQRAGAGGAGAAGRGCLQRGDRPAALHHPAHGEEARGEHSQQAGRCQPHAGGGKGT